MVQFPLVEYKNRDIELMPGLMGDRFGRHPRSVNLTVYDVMPQQLSIDQNRYNAYKHIIIPFLQ